MIVGNVGDEVMAELTPKSEEKARVRVSIELDSGSAAYLDQMVDERHQQLKTRSSICRQIVLAGILNGVTKRDVLLGGYKE